MSERLDLTISIVLYKTALAPINEAIDSVYKTKLRFKLYLIDNSPTDNLKSLKRDERTEYLFNNANIGFGKAHNIAMRKAPAQAKYHLVLNPDIVFETGVLEAIFSFMEAHPEVGQAMPKILYPNGEIQHLCKLLPTPFDLFARRFFPWLPGAKAQNKRYELIASGYDKVMNIPYLSGCFMFFRSESLAKVGYFDERIFMYIEDADLTRRMHQQYQTLFLPLVSVVHHYAKGSYKSMKLMMYNIHGAFVYFTKWGWFFDSERRKVNRKVTDAYLPR